MSCEESGAGFGAKWSHELPRDFWRGRFKLSGMLVVHVFVQVKVEGIELFKQATLANARASVQEPGIARFDVSRMIRPGLCWLRFIAMPTRRRRTS